MAKHKSGELRCPAITRCIVCLSDEEEEDADALLYLPVAPDIDEPEDGWPIGTENVSRSC